MLHSNLMQIAVKENENHVDIRWTQIESVNALTQILKQLARVNRLRVCAVLILFQRAHNFRCNVLEHADHNVLFIF